MCIDSQMLSAYLDNELSEPYKSQVEEHLSHCQACQKHLEKMKELSNSVLLTSFPEEKLNRKKDAVLKMMDNQYFSSKKKIGFFKKKVLVSIPLVVTTAAAVVGLIFITSFVSFGKDQAQTESIVPSFPVRADQGNVKFVSTKGNGLEEYTLEEILQYLDQKGYSVDISLKGLQTIE